MSGGRFGFTVACIAILASILTLTGCEDDGGSSHNFGDNNKNIVVCIGDSITEGGYPAHLAALLKGKTVLNLGIGGTVSIDGVARINHALTVHKPGYICILYGANDVIHGMNLDAAAENIRFMIQQAKANKTIPIVGTVTPATGNHGYMQGGIDSLNPKIKQVVKQEKAKLADLYAAMSGNPDLYLLDDGLHMNDAGNSKLAAIFRKKIK